MQVVRSERTVGRPRPSATRAGPGPSLCTHHLRPLPQARACPPLIPQLKELAVPAGRVSQEEEPAAPT